MKVVTILAGGWSASLLDLRKLPGTVIAVNDAVVYAPRWHVGVSMDRLWIENRWKFIQNAHRPMFLRRSTMKNVDASVLSHVSLFENDHTSTTLSDHAGRLNGTHSGFCALNLAFRMRPDEIYLVGFDMHLGPRGEKHWHPDYTWSKSTGPGRLQEWSNQFDGAAKQLDFADIQTSLVYAGKGEPYVKSFPVIGREAFEAVACEA